MATPQQVGPGVYYVPAEGQPVNAFSAFAAGFLKQRTPIAQALYDQRLAQLKPAERSQEMIALLGIMQQEKAKQQELRSAVLRAQSSGGTSDSAIASVITAQIQAGTKTNIASFEQDVAAFESGNLTGDQQFSLDELKRNIETGAGPSVLLVENFIADQGGKLSPAQQATVKRELEIVASGLPSDDASGLLALLNVRFADLPAATAPEAPSRGFASRDLLAQLLGGGAATGAAGAGASTAVDGGPPSEVSQLARSLFDKFRAEQGVTPDIDFGAPIFTRPGRGRAQPPEDRATTLRQLAGEQPPPPPEEEAAPELPPEEPLTGGLPAVGEEPLDLGEEVFLPDGISGPGPDAETLAATEEDEVLRRLLELQAERRRTAQVGAAARGLRGE